MTPTEQFVRRLQELQEGERSRLRLLAGRSLEESVLGFDLFAGLWWPLRQASPRTPRREPSWLVAKLFGAFPLPQVGPEAEGARLAQALGKCEPRDDDGRARFRNRFDTLVCSPLRQLEPHLRWALAVVADAVERQQCPGLDWVQLLDDLSIWELADMHRRRVDIREEWAEQYLSSAQ